MSLPAILVPPTLPRFIAAGHAITEGKVFAVSKPAAGLRRLRRLFSVSERVVDISWRLSQAQMVVLDDWFENALAAGDRFFSIQVQDQDSTALLWWRAKWLAPYRAEAQPGSYWSVTGQVKLYDVGTSTAPASTGLAVTFGLALTGTARLTVGQDLGTVTFGLALTASSTLGTVTFGLALTPPPPPLAASATWDWFTDGPDQGDLAGMAS